MNLKNYNNMGKLYRLKEEVKPYFDADYHEREMELGSWNCAGITIVALEEVRRAVVTVGSECGGSVVNISKWDKEFGGCIHFNVNLPEIGVRDFDSFCQNITEIAEKFEEVVNEMLNNK